jgi:hypothetical protein
MNQKQNSSSSIGSATFLSAIALALMICGASAGKLFAAAADSLDQLYEKAKKEGKITLYAPLSPSAMSVIPPAFMKRFPGVTVDHIDATSDKLIARVLSEQKGGRVLADVISGALTYLPQILDLKIVEHAVIPEAAAYPAQLKGDLWVATDTQFYIAGWNTNLVKKGEEPKGYEDLANPKWKDNIMGEPRDFQMLVGFAKRKYNNDEKAIDLFKKIAANQVEFHRGHSQLTEFLMAGQVLGAPPTVVIWFSALTGFIGMLRTATSRCAWVRRPGSSIRLSCTAGTTGSARGEQELLQERDGLGSVVRHLFSR